MRTLALSTSAAFVGFTIGVYVTGDATWLTAVCFAANALAYAIWLAAPSHGREATE